MAMEVRPDMAAQNRRLIMMKVDSSEGTTRDRISITMEGARAMIF